METKGTGRARQGTIRAPNGVVVVSFSDQLQEAIHTKCLRKCVV